MNITYMQLKLGLDCTVHGDPAHVCGLDLAALHCLQGYESCSIINNTTWTSTSASSNPKDTCAWLMALSVATRTPASIKNVAHSVLAANTNSHVLLGGA